MLLSICVPTKNRLALLKETLGSVLGQMDDEVEVIVRDNGSDDATPAYLQSLASGRFRVIFAERPGNFADNVNGLVRAVRGRFFVLLHDDDLLAPGAIAAIRAGLVRHPETELLVGTCVFFESTLEKVVARHEMPDAALDAEAAFGRFLPHWELRAPSLVYRTPADRTGDFYDERYGIAKDSVVLIDYLLRGRTTLVSPLVGYYRMGAHSETNLKVFTAGWGDNLLAFAGYAHDRFAPVPALRKYRHALYWTMYRGWQKDCGKHHLKRGRVVAAVRLLTGWALTTITGGRIHLPPPASLRGTSK